MKRIIKLMVAAAVTAFGAEALLADVVTNIYTVTTTSAHKRFQPLDLNNATLSVTTTAGGPESTITFSDLADGGFPSAAILVKRGEGYLMSSVRMATFKGEIRIEEGGFIVSANLMTGPQSIAEAPLIKVSSGATFMLRTNNDTCQANKFRLYNTFRIAGTGYENFGAIDNSSDNSQYGFPFSGPWYLDGDALIVNTTNKRWDSGDNSGSATFFIDLGGHNLTYRPYPTSPRGLWVWSVGMRVLNPGSGGILIDSDNLMLQNTGITWEGDALNELVFTNGCEVRLQEMTAMPIPWTTRFYGNTMLTVDGTSCGHGYTNRNAWAGPVSIDNGTLKVMRGESTAQARGTCFNGPLSGTGGLYGDNCWLEFVNGGKNITGPIGVTTAVDSLLGGLVFWGKDSVPQSCEVIAITNAQVYLSGTIADLWDFPRLDLYVEDGVTNSFLTNPGGASMKGGTIAGLRKSGPGVLELKTPFAVTGRTEIAGGILTLKGTELAGATYGHLLYDGPNNNSVPVGDIIVTHEQYLQTDYSYVENTNAVSLTMDPLYSRNDPMWWREDESDTRRFCIVTCAGYLWNRTGSTVNWTFAGQENYVVAVHLDGNKLFYQDNTAIAGKATVSVAPGPHYLQVRALCKTATTWVQGGPLKTVTNMSWLDGDVGGGVRWDPQGRNSDDIVDYVKISDPGDGSVMTVCTNGLSTGMRTVPTFNEIAFEGGTFDLNGNPVTVATLSGSGVVSNSSPYVDFVALAVTSCWSVVSADLTNGGAKVRFDGVPVVFGENARIVLSVARRGVEGTFDILESDKGFSGLPNLVVDGETRCSYSLKKSTDGMRLSVVCTRPGTVFILR